MVAPPDILASHLPALGVHARSLVPIRLRSKQDPSDLVQQTMLEAYQARERLEAMPERERAAYLHRSLKNNLLDALGKIRPTLTDPLDQQSSFHLEQRLVDDGTMPSERIAREERWREMAETLAALPESQRTAVELKYLDGLSVRDIAARMGVTEAAVGGLLRRGVRQLRERLGALPGDDNAGT